MSVGVKVKDSPIKQYSSGIITLKDCPAPADPTGLDHGVAIVGWGVENDITYAILKNSWGTRWGEQGYFRVGINNACGVALEATFPAYRC